MDSISNSDRNLDSEFQHLQDRMAELANAIHDRDAERRRALEREAKISALLESAPQGIITVNERGEILETNGMAERLFGYSRQEFEGLNLNALIPERFRANHSTHHAGFFSDPRSRRMACGKILPPCGKTAASFRSPLV